MSETTKDRAAPRLEELPRPLHALGEPVVRVGLRTITPIYGGGVHTRRVDAVDVIRVPSVRGQLRWWWRALFAGRYASVGELFAEERKRWGGLGDAAAVRRSAIAIEVEVDLLRVPKAYTPEAPHKTDVGYVLWPARGTEREPAAQCRPDGVEFVLTVRVDERRLDPTLERETIHAEVRDCVRAWILFGGYGGRTRRGFGSLTVSPELRPLWLPKRATESELQRLFERGRIFGSAVEACDPEVPRLAGSRLFLGARPHARAASAWAEAVDWLREFRQGVVSEARARSGEPGRQGRSNWPESDKVRRLAAVGDESWSHVPRHGSTPTWPRAGFGLPIIGQFQRKARDGSRYHEPPDYWLKWASADGDVRERLASPLILKALALGDGSFVPIALWLERAYPKGKVVLGFGKGRAREGSGAPFDRLCAAGDPCLFPPIEGHSSLRDAFMGWLPKYAATAIQQAQGRRSTKPERFHSRGRQGGPRR